MPDARTFFDKYAYDFDALYGVPHNPLNYIINPLFRKSMKLRFQKSIQYCFPIKDKTVFDVGCGPGHYSIALAKAGAKKIVGVDFADEMIKIAKEKARKENVDDICEFITADIFEYKNDIKFTYSILMGFMDYISDPGRLIQHIINLTQEKIFFSFPKDGGLLARQRKLRYQKRCPLYLYKKKDLIDLFSRFEPYTFTIEKISRDYFVTLNLASI